MEDLLRMKQNLIDKVEAEISGNLDGANTNELGSAVDMIKDLSEAIYYCTITEAMNDKDKEEKTSTLYYTDRMRPRMEYPVRYKEPYNTTMYYDGGNRGDRGMQGGDRSYYHDRYDQMYLPYEQRPTPAPVHDYREGRSPMLRKMYMEGKFQNQDKIKQMQGLESYMQELTQDLTEMIQDASPEEKQLLQQKISTLATKIK